MSKGKFIAEFKFVEISIIPYCIWDNGCCSFLFSELTYALKPEYYLDYENGVVITEDCDGVFCECFRFNYKDNRFIIDNEYFDLYYLCDNVKQKIEL